MWTFRITDGTLLHDGSVICDTAYSGFGVHANHPADESLKNLGPLPEGAYTIGAPEDVSGGPHGPYILRLTPDAGTDERGRSGFYAHGDNTEGHHTASHGCLILPRPVRVLMALSGDNHLEVIA